MRDYRGVGVALVTPFNTDLEVDYVALSALLEHTQKVDYYVVLGTTGESVTLSAEEKHKIVRHVVDHNQGRKPIVVGIGGNNTAQVIKSMQSFDLSGVDAILSVVPYYNKPTQDGIYAHYAEVLKNAPLPIILYNVPGRTGVNMSAATTLRLANDFLGRAIAVKEASGCLAQGSYILRDKPSDFLLISGDDNLTLPLISMGCSGVISVSANSFPAKMCAMTHYGLSGDYSSATPLALELLEATDLLFAEGNPAGVKVALELKGVMGSDVRLPLVKASDSLKTKLEAQIKKYQL